MEEKNIQAAQELKNKELFAYEMTQVLLMLRGEFAAFSGRGTRFEELDVENEHLRIPRMQLPQVELSNIAIEAPEAAKMPQVALHVEWDASTAVRTPEVPLAALRPLPEVGVEPIRVDLPDIPSGNVAMGKEKAVVTTAQIHLPWMKMTPAAMNCVSETVLEAVELPASVRKAMEDKPLCVPGKLSDVESVKTAEISAPHLPEIAVNSAAIRAVKVRGDTVELPQVPRMRKRFALDAVRVYPDGVVLPGIKANDVPRIGDAQWERFSGRIPDAHIHLSALAQIAPVKPKEVELPRIPAVFRGKLAPIETERGERPLPDLNFSVPRIPALAAQRIEKANVGAVNTQKPYIAGDVRKILAQVKREMKERRGAHGKQ